MALPMAAEALGFPLFTLDDLVGELVWPVKTDVGLVEQAGGIGAPHASDGDGVDLVAALRPDRVVLVASAGLGTLSNIGLSARALSGQPPVVYLNRFDPGDELHLANRKWLREKWALSVTTSAQQLANALLER
jgi:dethiobiotin synthetase